MIFKEKVIKKAPKNQQKFVILSDKRRTGSQINKYKNISFKIKLPSYNHEI